MLALLASVAPVHAKTNPSDLAAYVRARAADADGKAAMASSGYANALEAAPGDAVIALRAYRAAITAGDFVVLNRARMVLERANLAPADAALLALAEAVRDNDTAATQKAIDRIKTGPLDFLAPAFRAWAAMADPAAALTALDSVGTNPIERRYAQESRALLLLAAGKVDQGADLVRVMLGADRGSIDLRIAAAQILADSGRSDVSDGLFAGPDKSLLAVRQSIGKGRRATTAIGISYVLGRLSADLNDGQSGRLLIVMVRAALRLDPQNDRARLVLAEALAADDNPTMALAALDEIPASSPLKEIAAQRRIALLERGGNAAAALAAAARIAEKPDAAAVDIRRYADLLALGEQYDAAATAYRRSIDRDPKAADWVGYLQLGSALDRAGRWQKARPMLEKSVALAPDQPVALNYLGYGLLENGGDPATARKLLERASSLRPQDLSILDSLAWAYFQQGDVVRALPLLELAAKGEPANSTISEHLGDAYWHLGRRYEARYAWRAASVVADSADVERLAGKIANGPQAR
ncbi:tetratricopeptide repeat protein [Sphingomonas sp. 28-62-11]|uniref:tetratricopeptide repeat protein n=1 Tax=Sphingomonas sp. 28-62-11 TaxID=1970432 RepID=UPI000BC62E80|nr:MAG: hypothetical protein B7Y49_05790 [Sphingomonas sp. 28-62-11]